MFTIDNGRTNNATNISLSYSRRVLLVFFLYANLEFRPAGFDSVFLEVYFSALAAGPCYVMVGGAPYPRSDLFQFDRTALKGDILVHDGVSKIDYHEYAVFKAQDGLRPASQPGNDTGTARLREVSHSITSDHPSSGRLFDLALKEGHGLNSEVSRIPVAALYLRADVL